MSKYVELVIGVAGIVLAFIPNNNYLKVISILGAAVLVAVIRIYKVENENRKLKEEKFKEFDSNVLKEIKVMLYESQTIQFMQEHDFVGAFYIDKLDPLLNYHHKYNNDPEFYFLDSDLNNLKRSLDCNINEFLKVISRNTFYLESNPDIQAVPSEWREKQPDRFEEVVNKANHHATIIVKNYSELVQEARKKMMDF